MNQKYTQLTLSKPGIKHRFISAAVSVLLVSGAGVTHSLEVEKASVLELADRTELKLFFDQDLPDNVRSFTLGASPRVHVIDFPSGLVNKSLPILRDQAAKVPGLKLIHEASGSRIQFALEQDKELHLARSGKVMFFRFGGAPFVEPSAPAGLGNTARQSTQVAMKAGRTDFQQGILSDSSTRAVLSGIRVDSRPESEVLVMSLSGVDFTPEATLTGNRLSISLAEVGAGVDPISIPRQGRYFRNVAIKGDSSRTLVTMDLVNAQHTVYQQGDELAVLLGSNIRQGAASTSYPGASTDPGEGPILMSATGEDLTDSTEIRLSFSSPLATVPRGFGMTDPSRHVIDFKAQVGDNQNLLRFQRNSRVAKAQMVQSGADARLVLSLRDEYAVSQRVEGKDLVVQVRGPMPYLADSASTVGALSSDSLLGGVLSEADKSYVSSPLQSGLVSFASRIDKTGAEIISLQFDSERVYAKVDETRGVLRMRIQGGQLVSGFDKTKIDPYGKYYAGLSLEQGSQSLNLDLKLRGSEYQMRQQGRILELVLTADPTATPEGYDLSANTSSGAEQNFEPQYSGKPISLKFKNADINTVLQVFADFTDMNVVVSDSVKGTATVHLSEVPWDQALDIVLRSKGLVARNSGKVLLVMTAEDAARQTSAINSDRVADELEPLVSRSMLVSYQKTEDLVKLIRDPNSNLLSRRGRVLADERTSQLFLEDTPRRMEKLVALIKQLDRPVKQVMIEAKVVLADTQVAKELSAAIKAGRISLNGGELTTVGDTPTRLGDKFLIDSERESAVNGAYTLLTSGGTRFLNLQLKALEQQSRVKTVSNPRVITTNKEEAIIEQGTEIPYQVATSSGATSTEFREANLKLQVTPQIAPDGSIMLDVDVSKDSVGQETAQGLAINTRHVRTKVAVADGGTVVLGGIFEKANSEVGSKIPVLGDIPVIGNLFKGMSNSDSEAELLIFLTPVILGET